ncbi:MAG: S8 family serine peptidase, partial [Phycisphaerales bacterium]
MYRSRKFVRMASVASLACLLPAVAGMAQSVEDPAAARIAEAGAAAKARITLPSGVVVHMTDNAVMGQKSIRVPGSETVVATWQERVDGQWRTYSAISQNGRSLSGRVREISHSIDLAYQAFDPLAGEPAVDARLQAAATNDQYIVQFVTIALPELQKAIEAAGGTIIRFLPDTAVLVRMPAATRARVAGMPHVRWVGANHVAYKVEPGIVASILAGADAQAEARYSIECATEGPADQQKVADAIRALGGAVDVLTPDQYRMEATLNEAQLLAVAAMNEVHYIDPWGGPAQKDMNIVRSSGGGNFIESTLGLTGQGVRGEVFDSELRTTHQEFSLITPLSHSGGFGNPADPHGTSVFSIVFGRGASANARGMLPNAAEGYYYDPSACTQFGGAQTRLAANQQLVNPAGTFRCVFQTSSIGSTRTTTYSTISAEVDNYLFQTQLLSTQSQSNAGWFGEVANNSRPQAWAKNIVSVGGIYHLNSASRADDRWISAVASCGSPSGNVSSGPASDGRIKPDLSFFNDCIFSASNGGNATYTEFGGTSSATPMTGGHFGLFFQMWHDGVWAGHGGGSDVFDSRCKMTTAKAALISTAFRYNWPAGGANGDLTRVRQGWGTPDLQNLYNLRAKTFIVDEEDVIAPLGSKTYYLKVAPGEANLNAVMCYVDRQGNPAVQATHRVNDLSMRVTAPNGTFYWGNNGLSTDNSSSTGGVSNTKDTVECVFVPSPAAGIWKIEVFGDVITQDTHTETVAVDADFSLWVTGGLRATEVGPFAYSVQSNGNDHLYRIDLGTGIATDLGLVGNGDIEGLSFGPNGRLYGLTGTGAGGQLWDLSVPPGSLVGNSVRANLDAGMDYYNGQMYNIQGNSGASSLYRVNTTTGAPTLLGSNALYFGDLAIDLLGNAFASENLSANTLYSINLTNGAATLVGALGVNPGQFGTSFDDTGTLWALDDGGQIYTIDTATGAATTQDHVTINGVDAAGFEGLAIDKYSASARMDIPAFGSTFSGNTRGYWFTAPYNTSITGLRVPDETNTNSQNVEVIRLSANPPTFPATTNNFESLGRFVNVAGGS